MPLNYTGKHTQETTGSCSDILKISLLYSSCGTHKIKMIFLFITKRQKVSPDHPALTSYVSPDTLDSTVIPEVAMQA
ncbi:hypothetical protein C8E00_101255 [Chromohalobacter marismortui]|uniref:Uncharacterized protein n=1 Tax=Chromohalobacter marismortui TaxID=42055 RepID=A0A4R7NW30_9GAMM|nr:hypothetical protein C8E00_101255 [Chromohalobacter marismortui]